jgi:hypothetical protein
MPYVGPPDDTTENLEDNFARQENQASDLITGMMFSLLIYITQMLNSAWMLRVHPGTRFVAVNQSAVRT